MTHSLSMDAIHLGIASKIFILIFLQNFGANAQNSFSPTFASDTYNADCQEGSLENVVILTLTATDGDTGPAGQLDYSMEENDWFKINSTGTIKVKAPIDAENEAVDATMIYKVTATDRGTPTRSGETTVHIKIGDENEARPRFTESIYFADLYEGDPVGTPVIMVEATDRDRDAVLTYDLPIPFPYFNIDKHTGNITVGQTVDYDAILASQGSPRFQIKARANDTKFLELITILTSINRKNHFPPEFESTVIEVSVDEGQSGVLLTTVRATDDKDYRTQTVTYGLRTQEIPGSLSIGANDGRVTLVQTLDREALTSPRIEQLITAEDDGDPNPVLTSTATLIITVNDINDNSPVYAQPTYQLAIPQTYQAGETFTLPTATDADVGENAKVVYQLNEEGAKYFTVNRDSSVLTTHADCGRECIKTEDCSLGTATVYAFNEGLPLLNDSLVVEIVLTRPGSLPGTPATGLISCADASTPNNNDPVFDPSSYRASVREDAVIDSRVLVVRATDADAGNSGDLTYSLNSPVFGVNNDGEVYTLQSLDYEQLPADKSICVDVVATDQGRPPKSSTAEVCITVENVNDNPPSFANAIYTAQSRDGDATGTSVITITANDADGTDDVTYELLGTNPYFTINPTTGLISLAQRMNKADILSGISGERVEIDVKANNGRFSAETVLWVTIESSNKFTPEFGQNVVSLQVPEGTTGVVLTLTASDQDFPVQTIRYQLASQTFNGIFSVDSSTGELRVVSNIDRENLPSALGSGTVAVEVLAVDNGSPQQNTGTATVNVEIIDINDNNPQFTETYYEIRLSETFTPGQVFQLPDATDNDLGENAQIAYEVSAEARTRFTVSGNSLTTSTTCDKSCVKTQDCALLKFSVFAYNLNNPLQRTELPVYVSLLKTGSTRPLTADPNALPNCTVVPSPNNNDPKFSQDQYDDTMSEGVPPNTVVLTVSTTDDDWGDSGKVTYTITNSTIFGINDNGEIFPTRDLDYENPADRQTCMQVVATDGGTPPRSASTVVCLNLLNENDNSPVFPSGLFTGSVSDGDPPGVFVAQVTATDSDANSVIRYDFVSPNNYFQIDPVTGNVTVSRTVDRASIPNSQVDLTVRASDGEITTTTILRVTIAATNKFPPRFTQTVYNRAVNESLSGVTVVQVSATDDDNPQEQITYSIFSSTLPNIFSINPTTGEVRLVQALDREALPQGFVEAVIVARDSGVPPPQRTATATLRLQVNDLNDNVPQFPKENHDLLIFQNFTSGESFTLPQATDADISDTIMYELSDNAKQFFTLDPSTGVVTTRTVCDDSCKKLADCDYMTFTLAAYNPDTPQLRDTLTVKLTLLTVSTTRTPTTDIKSCSDTNSPNDHDPKFSQDKYDGTVSEGIPPNTVVLTVSTTDDDWGDSGKVTYTITNSTIFGINDNGEIFPTRDLDYENPADRQTCMQVVATDGGTPPRSASTVVCLNLLNENDNSPVFSSDVYTVSVSDGDPPGVFVAQVTATDSDANSVIRYDFVSPNNYFQIDPVTGNVTVSRTVDRASIPNSQVDLTVRASDGEITTTTILRVTISATNKFPPRFTQTVYNRAVNESLSGVTVVQVSATDDDNPQEQITYSIFSSTLPNIFSINPTTGEVRLVQALDREALPQGFVEAVIVARDSGVPPPQRTATATLRLQVNDLNDNVPQFPTDFHDLYIFQNFTAGAPFQLPTATDPDISDTIMYDLSDNAKQFFTVDPSTGVVTTRTDCDASCQKLEDCREMTFTLSAYNPGSPQLRDTLTVRLTLLAVSDTRTPATDVKACSDTNSPNLHDPTFTEDGYEGTVTEGVPPNTVVLTVNTTDDDWGDSGKVTYTITNSTIFGINDNGEIFPTRDLDYENPADRQTCMQVVATDGGTPPRSASTVVCLNLVNANDHRPRFTSPIFQGTVNDGDLPGTFVVQISATDRDEGSRITYDFPLNSTYFHLDENSGNVTVAIPIVRSDIILTFPNALISTQVRAYDGKFLEITQLRVTVVQVNHFAPVFNQTVYNAAVDEGVSGVVVAQITAKDDDVPRQAITYSIFNSTIPNIFSINPTTGEVRLVQALDREALPQGFVEAVIVARDSGVPPPQRTATATLRLQVNDLNDNVPQFPTDFHDLYIFQNFTAGEPFQLPTATDPDISDTIMYDLSDNAKQFFTVDPITGVVTTRTDCDASCQKLEDCREMTFTLSAYNPGSPQLRDTLTVRLTLLAVGDTRTPAAAVKACSDTNSPNLHDPTFSEDGYEGTVTEGVPPNTVVLTVNTTDDDWGDSGKVTYTITNSTIFGINDNGEIFPTRDLDYENPADRQTCMQVVATDGGTPPRSASTVVCLNLLNANDHRPRFTSPIFQGTVNDGDLPGTFVVQISATDRDEGSRITYDFPLNSTYFHLDENSGNVTVAIPIVRSDIILTFPNALISTQVRAYDGKFLEITQLRVTVVQVNHFAPVFNQTVYNAAVDEGVSGVVVAQVTAKDDDVPRQAITYSIFNSTIPNIFSINPTTGEVRLVQALDREAIPQGFLEAVIVARDSGVPPPQRTATATLRLQVNDLNDNVPQFPKDFHDLLIFQNFTSGQRFPLPQATDADISDTIMYELSDNAKQFFTLDPSTGVVTTRTVCDDSCKKLADCDYMTFTLWAYNPGTPQQRDSLTVTLRLLTVSNTRTPDTDIKSCSDTNSPNEHDPKFSQDQYDGTVSEGVPPNTVVVTVSTTDDDWGDSGKVTYTITNSTVFGINDNGEIFPIRDLDYENPADRRTCMQVVATDGGTPPRSASTVVCITVENQNEYNPSFGGSSFIASAYDRDAPGTFVVQLQATDRDSDATIAYDFVSPSEYFQINALNGNITVKKTIDRDLIVQDTGSEIVTLSVRASDGQLSTTAQLRVTIVKKNDFAPQFGQTVYQVSVVEETVNNPLVTVTASDEDSSTEIIKYRIVNVTNIVSIDSSTGVIRLTTPLDRESLADGGVLDILVEAMDSGRPPPFRSSTATVRIAVTDVNDNAPTFDTDVYNLELYQNFTSGDVYVIPTASDPDADSTIMYTVDPTDPWFEIDPNTGRLRMRVDCGDSCVKIQDCYYGEVIVFAYNPDKPDTRAKLTVKVTMLTTATTDKIVTQVLPPCPDAKPPNKNDPSFSKPNYVANVTENSPENTVVVTVTATDPDWGDSGDVIYTITNSTDFGINQDGQIYVIKPPDHESTSGSTICIQVEARDQGAPPRYAYTVVCIDVTDVNDNDPVFGDSYQGNVYDGDLPGKWVVQVLARDADPGTRITYDFETGSPYFQIDPISGNITVSQTIARSAIIAATGSSILSLRVRASDSQRTTTTGVVIIISPMNEHPPRFTTDVYRASVDEETPNADVIQVEASDEDLPRNAVNYFLQPSNYSDHFRINSIGEITLVKKLDRESLADDTIRLIVVAVDSGTPPPKRSSSATVLVRVRDINDNPPYFLNKFVEIRLLQNFTAGVVRQLPRALDDDLGVNAQIGYQLSLGADTYFDLDTNTAVMTTRRGCADCLRGEDYDWLVLILTAFNRNRPDLSSQLQVTVKLLAVDSGPRVDELTFSKSVVLNRAEVKPSDTVFITEDLIGGPAGHYIVEADNVTMSMFGMTQSGEIFLSSLPAGGNDTYTLTIKAIGVGQSRQNMTVTLLVTFVDDPSITILDEKGIAAISAICAIVLLIIILVLVHIIWWKTRHKKDKKEQVMMEEDMPRGCCCGKPLIAVQFNGESSL